MEYDLTTLFSKKTKSVPVLVQENYMRYHDNPHHDQRALSSLSVYILGGCECACVYLGHGSVIVSVHVLGMHVHVCLGVCACM